MILARLCIFAWLLCFLSGPLCAQPPAAAIATAHPLATAAGERIIRQGGNAFDAAVAITAALAVVEPYGSGLGGGGLWLLHIAGENRQLMVDGSVRAPALAHWRLFQDENGRVNTAASRGSLSAAIPGIPAAIVYLAEHFGRLPLRRSLAPAIAYAKKGFVVSERYHHIAGRKAELLQQYPQAAATYLQETAPPAVGSRIIQQELAGTLETIAAHGHDGFYRGEVAEKLVFAVRANGGVWSTQDLADYRLVLRAPVVSAYHDVRIIAAAPPSSGGVALSQALNILAVLNLPDMDTVSRKHIIIEAMRRAYRDQAVYLGDPDYNDVPLGRLLDDNYTGGLAMTIEMDRATASTEIGDTPGQQQSGTRTSHFSVLDSAGNRVAATLSINGLFGSGFVAGETGVLLNNGMGDFTDSGGDANSLQPGKRPVTSMSPVLLESEDRIAILGTSGGSRIISTLLLAVLDFEQGNGPESWVSLPRYHHQYLPDVVSFENEAFTQEELNVLRRYGHKLEGTSQLFGNMQAVMWDRKSNQVFAASDPRGEGAAGVIYGSSD
jgi:gamma-glutamyltranspeptidase/glutathione hydrolase